MNIVIDIRSVYGNNVAYPACDKGRTFAAMLGTKTLTRRALCSIIDLGYIIEARASCPGITFAVKVSKASDLPAVQ